MSVLDIKNELVAARAKMAAVDVDSDDFSHESWDALKTEVATLSIKLDKAKNSAAIQADQSANATQATQVAAPVLPQGDSKPHVTGMNPRFESLQNHGFESDFAAGELIADHISFKLHGGIANDSSDGYKMQRYENYCQFNGYENAAGTASTVIDGLEIMPTMIPGLKQYGGGFADQALALFNPLSTANNRVKYFTNTDTYNVDGLTASRINEGGTQTSQNFSNKMRQFDLFKLGVFAKITEEDLQNVPLLQSRYAERAPAVLEVQMLQDILDGNGVGMNTGILDAANTASVAVARAGGSAIDLIDLANMEKQYFRKNGNGVYLTNQSTLGQLMTLADVRGARIWQPNANDGITSSMLHGTLNGRPLIVSEYSPALGTKGDLSLINPAGYVAARHTSGVRFATSLSFYFDADAMALRWLSQYGGQPAFNEAYTPRKGGEDLSHFVLLDVP